MTLVSDIESRLAAIRAQREQLVAARAQAETRRDYAQQNADSALRELEALGAATPDDARKMIADLETEVGDLLGQAETALERIPL